MPVLGKKSLETLKGVHPDLVEVIKESIKECPVDFTVFSGVRTLAEQKHLYSLGRTVKNPDGYDKVKKPLGNIVTKADGVKTKSNHQVKADGLGHAVDLVPYIDGKLDWNTTANYKIISAHILATAKCLGINVAWGGNFKSFVDYPHFELKK